jgi:signal transduction histidine kinase
VPVLAVLVEAGMIGALAVALWVHRPPRPIAWCSLAGGLILILAGNSVWYPSLTGALPALPFPSFADGLFIFGYLGYVGGLLLIARRGATSRRWGTFIDALIVTAGIAVLYWDFLIEPDLRADGSSGLTLIVALSYPALDLLLLGAGVWLALSRRRRPPAFWLLLGAVAVQLANDTAFGLMTLRGASLDKALFMSAYPLSFALLGAAFLHPSMRWLMHNESSTTRESSLPRMTLIGASALIAPLALIVHVHPGGLDLVVIGSIAVGLFVLVLFRLGGVIAQLNRAEAARRYALAGTLKAVEEQRREVAADLHDGPIQGLPAYAYVLERACLRLRREFGETAAGLVSDLRGGLSDQIEEVRQLMTTLRPAALDERGLEAALRDFGEALFSGTPLSFAVDVDGVDEVPPELQTTLFRIAQEALRNVVRHAGASEAGISLESGDDLIVLAVEDDGRGFDPQEVATRIESNGHFGLTAMNAHAEMAGGTIEIDSRAGHTSIRAAIPRERVPS